MCRKASGGTTPASGPSQTLSPASILQVQKQQQQSHQIIVPGAAAAAQSQDTHDGGETVSSISSSVFRRDDGGGKGGRRDDASDKTAAALLSKESSLRDARLDVQHRLRLIPAALWGERARLADANDSNDAIDAEEAEQTTATQQQRTFLTGGACAVPSGKRGAGPAAALNHGRKKSDGEASAGKKRIRNDATAARKSSSRHDNDGHGPAGGGGGGGFALPIGASALFAQAASLKRTAVTASVPLRWQSRVIALSSLRDSFRQGATRGSPSMGRKMAIRSCRANSQRTKAKRFGKNVNKPLTLCCTKRVAHRC